MSAPGQSQIPVTLIPAVVAPVTLRPVAPIAVLV